MATLRTRDTVTESETIRQRQFDPENRVVISTDTAFLVGALALIRPMFPARVRVFLLTLAVVDDVGALGAIALTVFAFTTERRTAPKVFAFILLFLVIAQGIFGAIRVGAASSGLAAFHGVFAQITLAFAAITACKALS